MSYINNLDRDFIEKSKSIEGVDDILIAKLTGSRAMDLNHSESDYDITVIFRQNPKDYILLDRHISSIKDEIYDGWEIEGWNLDKFAELTKKSNPTLIEFLLCPTVYCKDEKTYRHFQELKEFTLNDPNLIGLYKTYISQAESNYKQYIQSSYRIIKSEISNSEYREYLSDKSSIRIEEELFKIGDKKIDLKSAIERGFVRQTETERTVKRNLFIIRSICCAMWVRIREEVPPIKFEKLIEEQTFLDKETEKDINYIIKLKKKDMNHKTGDMFEKTVKEEINKNIDQNYYNSGQFAKEEINKFISPMV